MAKVKLFNKNKFDVGIKLINPIREQNIKPNSFTIIDEDDVFYLDSICGLLKRGILRVEKEEVKEALGHMVKNPNIIDDKEIETLLLGNFMKMKKKLSDITEPHIKSYVYDIACNLSNNLSGSKIKFLNTFCGRDIVFNDNN